MLFTAPMDMVLDLSMEDTPPTPDQLSPAMPDQLFHPLDTLPTPDQFMEDTPATMERETLRLNPRLMLMLFIAPMDMVLVLDLFTEDTPPTPDQLSLAMPDQLFPPLDTPPTPDLSMEDTQATMARERLRLNQRLMLMLSTAPMDMVLDILPTPDLSTEDTLPTPDQLSLAMPDQLFPPLDTLPTPDQFMEDTPATMERERLRLNLRLMLFTAPMDMVLDLSTEDTPPTPDQLSPAM